MVIPECDLEAWCARQREKSQRLVFTNGCFDILHAGHVRYLARARALGDCLVVGLNSDASVRCLKGASRPINPEADRAEVLDALRAVDGVVIFGEPTAAALIERIRPDIYAKGGDYTLETLPEAELVQRCGGEVRLLPLAEGRSSSRIIARVRALR